MTWVPVEPDPTPGVQWVPVGSIAGPPGPPGPQGLPGSAPTEYRQDTPAASWTITHGLGYKPIVTLFLDSNPEEPVFTDVFHLDVNTVYVEWSSPESGWAYAH